ncbi:MAG: type III pantothenate kinase [Candidatus Nealsonbacteria bacterium]|nr:type III pantothenate kinase [Candidatus Nealsonbacteria bacterium]
MVGTALPTIAVDIGNARIKLGLFVAGPCDDLPTPKDTLTLDGNRPQWARLASWLEQLQQPQAAWWIGSVNRPVTTRLLDWIRDRRPADPATLLAAGDLSLAVEVPRPDMVGIDRLLDAVAVNRLRRPGRPAVVADVGTAITVDAISADGAFLGGAILPGIGMSARAFHEFTDLLPLIEMSELATPPPALGTATEPAMRSGLYWGAVGAIRQLVGQLTADLGSDPEIFLTGGAGPAVAELLAATARHVPHLTLAGIALAAQGQGGQAVNNE